MPAAPRSLSSEFTRYFLDFEFIEDGKTIEIISIGVVCEDGRKFYAESDEVDLSKANPWVIDNVIPYLGMWDSVGDEVPPMSRADIALSLLKFVNDGDKKPRFWGYYADYDWIALCQLYGRMIDLPEGWPMLCFDIKQLHEMCGCPPLPPQDGQEHHALADAEWNMKAFNFLRRWIEDDAGRDWVFWLKGW